MGAFDGSTSSNLLALHAPTSDVVDVQKLTRTIRNSISQHFGDHGASVAGGPGFKIVYWSNATSTLIVRCRRETVRLVWAALCLTRTIPGLSGTFKNSAPRFSKAAKVPDREVALRVVRNSGTIKKSLEEVVSRNKIMMGRLKGMQATSHGLQSAGGHAIDADLSVQGALGVGKGSRLSDHHHRDETDESEVAQYDPVGNVEARTGSGDSENGQSEQQ